MDSHERAQLSEVVSQLAGLTVGQSSILSLVTRLNDKVDELRTDMGALSNHAEHRLTALETRQNALWKFGWVILGAVLTAGSAGVVTILVTVLA